MSGADTTLWAIVAAYIAIVFAKGLAKARQVRTSDDFLLAGRQVPGLVLACTIGATVIGGGASIGAIGNTHEMGLLWALVTTGWYLQFVFSGLYIAPKFREARLYTVAGYFWHRFGKGPGFVAFILSLVFSVFILAAQMTAFGTVLAVILPEFANSRTVMTWAIVIGGAMVVIYSTAGGLMAVIHTDIYQFVLLLVGFVATLLYCLPELAGSWEASRSALPETFLMADGGKGWLVLLGLFLTFLLGETFAPGYATRFCVGRDIRHTRMGIAGIGIFLTLVFPAVVFLISLYARIQFPDADSQQALPLVIRNLPSVLVAGLFIGALLMAVMSSADSALNSATAIFVKDLFEEQLGWHNVPDGRILRLARICSAALGLIAVAVAAANPDIIALLLFSYMLWAPAIVLPICIGVFSKRRSRSMDLRILIVMLVSTAATLAYHFGLPKAADYLHPTLVGVGVSAGTWLFLSAWSSIRPPQAD